MALVVYVDDERKFDGIYYLTKPKKEILEIFPMDKLKNLRENALATKWYIPVKLDEAFGLCLTAAVKLAQEGKSVDDPFDLKVRFFSRQFRET